MNIVLTKDFNKDLVEIKNNAIHYNNNYMFLQSCILYINDINVEDNSDKKIVALIKSGDILNVKFMTTIQEIEEKIKNYIDDNATKLESSIKMHDNKSQYIKIKITEDSLIFNKAKKRMLIGDLFKSALCIVILSFSDLIYTDYSCKYELNLIQAMII